MIYEANIGSGGSQLSFNPLNWKNLCLIGANRICLYNLEQCDAELFLSPMYKRKLNYCDNLFFINMLLLFAVKWIFQIGQCQLVPECPLNFNLLIY